MNSIISNLKNYQKYLVSHIVRVLKIEILQA